MWSNGLQEKLREQIFRPWCQTGSVESTSLYLSVAFLLKATSRVSLWSPRHAFPQKQRIPRDHLFHPWCQTGSAESASATRSTTEMSQWCTLLCSSGCFPSPGCLPCYLARCVQQHVNERCDFHHDKPLKPIASRWRRLHNGRLPRSFRVATCGWMEWTTSL